MKADAVHNQARAAGINGDWSLVAQKPLLQLEAEGCVPASFGSRDGKVDRIPSSSFPSHLSSPQESAEALGPAD